MILGLALLGPLASAQDGAPRGDAARYALPDGYEPPGLTPPLEGAVRAAVRTLHQPVTPEEAQRAVRLLAGLGGAAAPHVVDALGTAPWHTRALLVSALAEMDAPALTPVLATASRDTSFAVRAAAVVGLGKTGDATGQAALLERADPATEPVWRVRVRAAEALRRARLRGVVEGDAGASALVAMLGDADRDVRLAALGALAPLALDEALPGLLTLFDDREGPRDFRVAALEALGNYRTPREDLVSALRTGFVETDDAQDAATVGRALLALRGAQALEDDATADTVLRRLRGPGSGEMRAAIARLGADAAPWLRREATRLAQRIAAGRAVHEDTSIEPVVELLVQVDPEQGAEFLRELLVGPDAEVLELDTRRFALRVVEIAFAERFRDELRVLFEADAGRDLRPAVLRAIVKSGGDDVAERVDRALEHESRAVRAQALHELKKKHVTAGPRLREIAARSEDTDLRATALDTLARHDADEAARLAADLLDHPQAVLRSKAVTILSHPGASAHFERLLERFRAEDGSDSGPDRPAPKVPTGPDEDGLAPLTASTAKTGGTERRRTRMRCQLLLAVRITGGERARPLLIEVLEGDDDPAVREQAVRELRPHVTDDDAERLLARLAVETEPRLQRELRGALARTGGSEEARAYFAGRIAEPRTRAETLDLLRVDDARVLPEGLAEGLFRKDWRDDAKEAALLTLERAGVPPAPAKLGELARTCITKELCAEALRVLVATGGDAADAELTRLLAEIDDEDKLSEIVLRLGARRVAGSAAGLRPLLDRLRKRAMGALSRRDSAVELYRRTAVALARCGGAAAAPTLVSHLLHPQLEQAAGRLTVLKNGPFQPREAATIYLVRGLVRALAELDEPTIRSALRAHLDALAVDGRDLRLDEGYVDGVALYLRDPAAYELPARRRPDAALELRALVPRLAPRMSPLDVEALKDCATDLESRGAFDAALEYRRAHAALAAVEAPARPPEDLLWDAARLVVTEARVLHAQGRADDALALVADLRAPDPASWRLAYLHGYARVKLGRPDEEARASLRHALALHGNYASAAFHLAWVTDALDGVQAALPLYGQAVKLDVKQVYDAGGEYLTHRRGRTHRWAEYPYWLARARVRAGDLGVPTLEALQTAIRHDDRAARQALRDPVFQAWDELDAIVAEALTMYYPD